MTDALNPRGQGPCSVIAEIGSNHGGDLATALKMVEKAASCGAAAVKFQKRDNATLYSKDFYKSGYNSENAYGPTYGEHREALELDKHDFCVLKARADEVGVIFLSTAFDEPSVDFLRDLDCCSIKIASGSLTDTPLISYAAASGANLILSTGGGSLDDISRALDAASGAVKTLLHCTASYPCPDDLLNLRCIQTYKQIWPELTIGASLHGYGPIPGIVAYTLGAEVLEMHFTLDRTSKGTDHAFSLEPDGLRSLTRWLKRAEKSMGDGIKTVWEEEKAPILKMSRCLRAASAMRRGHLLEPHDITLKAPGAEGALPPYLLQATIGRKLTEDVEEEQPLTPQLLA